MPSANRFASELVRLQARVEWLIHRLEALDARLVAVELQMPLRRKRPPSRAVGRGGATAEGRRVRSADSTSPRSRKR